MTAGSLNPVVEHLRRLVDGQVIDQLSDTQLLECFLLDREPTAFAALMRRHGAMVLGVCRRVVQHAHDAEDVFQATFLVLARKAASVRNREAVGSWLHGVALKLAKKFKMRQDRCRQRERAVPAPGATEPSVEAAWRELQTLLDAEIQRLPARYREPLLLCYLEGKTHEEVARQLGCPVGTVHSWLVRGRDLLRDRLQRRGLPISGAVLAAVVVVNSSTAAVTSALFERTLQAALLFVAGTAGPGTASAAVVALTQSGVKSMNLSRLALMLSLTLALGLATAGTVALPVRSGQPSSLPPAVADPAPAAEAFMVGSEPPRVLADMYDDLLPGRALVRMGTVRFRHPGLHTMVFSRDGKQVASSGQGGVVLWDGATGRALRHFATPGEHAAGVLFSADGRTLAAGTFHHSIWLWDVATGRPLNRFGKKHHGVRLLAYSADGKTLTSCDGHSSLVCWDVATGQELAASADRLNLGGKAVLSPDGSTLVTWHVGQGKSVSCYDVVPSKPFDALKSRSLVMHQTAVQCAVFSGDSRQLITGSSDAQDKQIRVWDMASGKESRSLSGYAQGTRSLAVSPDGKLLFSAGYQRLPTSVDAGEPLGQLRELETGKELARFSGYFDQVVFAPDGKRLASRNGTAIQWWDATTGQALPGQGSPTQGIRELTFSPDGRTLATLTGNRTGEKVVRLWDVATGKEQRQLQGHLGCVNLLACAPDGQLLASGGEDRTICLWDMASGKELHRFESEPRVLAHLSFAAGGKVLVHQNYGGPICVWDVAKRHEQRRIVREQLVQVAASSADGRFLLLTYQQGKAALLDLDSDRELPLDAWPPGEGAAVALSADGRLLAAHNTVRKTISVWDGRTGRRLHTLPAPFRALAGVSLKFSADGKVLATAEPEDSTLRLWDAASGRLVRRLVGAQGGVLGLAFTRDGRRLASGGADTTSLVWDVQTLPPVAPTAAVARSPQELRELWDALAARPDVFVYAALWDLVAARDQSVDLLKEKLQPAAAVDRQRLVRLIAGLDDGSVDKRQQAAAELEALGEAAEEALQRLLTTKPALEVCQRAENVLQKLAAGKGERRRLLLAVEALEYIGSSAARQVLEALVKGAAEARLTREAKAALERLDRCQQTP
jgi:RNA polymerase sigma factor (sigma-70 family)